MECSYVQYQYIRVYMRIYAYILMHWLLWNAVMFMLLLFTNAKALESANVEAVSTSIYAYIVLVYTRI